MDIPELSAGEDTRDMDQFFAEENARERGQTLPASTPVIVPRGDAITATTDEAGESASVVGEVVAPKVDKRTREGRLASLQADFDAKTREIHQVERDLLARRAELAALPAKDTQTSQTAVVTTPTVVDDPEPTLDQFATEADPYTAWLRATHKWDTRQELKAHDAQHQRATQQQQVHAAQIARMQAHDTRYTAALTADPTLATKISPLLIALKPLSALPIDQPGTAENAIAEEIIRSDYGPAMMAELSEDPDRFRRLATLPTGMTQSEHALAIIREMAILETEVRLTAARSSSPTVSPRVISAAKPPLKLVGTSPVVSDDGVDEGELDTDEFIRRGNARDLARKTAAIR